MQFLRRWTHKPDRLGVLPVTFYPVTVAHLALAGTSARREHHTPTVVAEVRFLQAGQWLGIQGYCHLHGSRGWILSFPPNAERVRNTVDVIEP